MQNITNYQIRHVLAELYPNYAQAELVARDSNLQLRRIAHSPVMEIYWENIWREANFQHKGLDLIRRVQMDFPRDDRIAQIHAHITHIQTQRLPPTQSLPPITEPPITESPTGPRWRPIALTILIILIILVVLSV